MELQTTRLQLTALTFADLHDIHQLHSLPEVDQFNTLGIPANMGCTAALLKKWLRQANAVKRKSFIFRISKQQEGNFIGLIALNLGKSNYRSAEVWYKFTHYIGDRALQQKR